MKNKQPQIKYSEEFKRMVVEEIEAGVMTVNQAIKYYNIGGGITVYNWVATYGMNSEKGKKVLIMSNKEQTELMTLRKENLLLKKQLEEAELRSIAWKSMVDAIEYDLKIPVKKKPWSQALLDARKLLYPDENDSMPPESADSTESANKPATKGVRRIKRK